MVAVGMGPHAGRDWKSDVLVREPTGFDVRRIAWEVTERCNFRCGHCYLGDKTLGGLPLENRLRLLDKFVSMGCLWLQLTGGEALADSLFEQTYRAAWNRGMMISVSTNGILLSRWIGLFRDMPPRRVTVSLYGASDASYAAMAGTAPGAYDAVIHGLNKARANGLRLRVSVIAAKPNVHEVAAMEGILRQKGIDHHVYSRMIPTLEGNRGPLELMADIDRPKVFFCSHTGCAGGTLALHVRASGRASPCRLLSNISVDLLSEDLSRVRRLAHHPGVKPTTPDCAGCLTSDICLTCTPIFALHKKAGCVPPKICRHQA